MCVLMVMSLVFLQLLFCFVVSMCGLVHDVVTMLTAAGNLS